MNPSLSLGPITLYYYGLILALAIVVAYVWSRRRAVRAGIPADVLDTLFITTVPLGIIGARIYFVIFSWAQFSHEPLRALQLWEGGLAIHGALLGGALGLLLGFVIARKKHASLRIARLFDIVAPTLLLAQAIGRFGNFVNREAFGGPTNLPWGLFIPPERRPPGLDAFTHFHPTFAYEAIWNLIGVAVLLVLERRWSKRRGSPGKLQGTLLAAYLVWYSLGRGVIEGLRADSLYLGPLRVAQLASVVGVVGGLAYLWYRIRQWHRQSTPTKA